LRVPPCTFCGRPADLTVRFEDQATTCCLAHADAIMIRIGLSVSEQERIAGMRKWLETTAFLRPHPVGPAV